MLIRFIKNFILCAICIGIWHIFLDNVAGDEYLFSMIPSIVGFCDFFLPRPSVSLALRVKLIRPRDIVIPIILMVITAATMNLDLRTIVIRLITLEIFYIGSVVSGKVIFKHYEQAERRKESDRTKTKSFNKPR